MSGTVTHKLAQNINSIIRLYLDETHIVKSSQELLLKLNGLTLDSIDKFCSLDVESLFTNVPVMETIDIICNEIYHRGTSPPPTVPEQMMRDLLTICTTQTPFDFNNSQYLQLDGVSMGSPLGPTFADFYMSNL